MNSSILLRCEGAANEQASNLSRRGKPSSSHLGTHFVGRIWHWFLIAVVLNGLGAFSLIVGPLFCFGGLRTVGDATKVPIGFFLLIVGVILLVMGALGSYQVILRQRPLLRICREGIEFLVIGRSSLDENSRIGRALHVVWLLLSLQGFRREVFRAPWEYFAGVTLVGPVSARTLTIHGKIFQCDSSNGGESLPIGEEYDLPEAAFDVSLDRIAFAIQKFAANPLTALRLESWDR